MKVWKKKNYERDIKSANKSVVYWFFPRLIFIDIICSHQLGNKFVENNIIPSKVFFSILALPMYQLYGYKIVPNSNCNQTADE